MGGGRQAGKRQRDRREATQEDDDHGALPALDHLQGDGAPQDAGLGGVEPVPRRRVVEGRILVRQILDRKRQLQTGDRRIYGDKADWIRSEACLKLDFGPGRLPGLLVLGAEDPHQFTPQQGTDLLAFFSGVFERAMRRWLS